MMRLRTLRGQPGWKLIVACIAVVCCGCASSRSAPAIAHRVDVEARYKSISDNIGKLAQGGRITQVRWNEDGKNVEFSRLDQTYRFDFESRTLTAIDGDARSQRGAEEPSSRRRSAGRGKQHDSEPSPDGKWLAVCEDWNVILRPTGASDGSAEEAQTIAVTSGGHRKFRYGKASWVYGEELDQNEAMWWSPDSRKLVFYEFDERQVPDHFLTSGLSDLHTAVLTEGYPKPGEPNPIANLLIYDLESGSTVKVNAGEDANQYVYAVRFAPDGSELLFNRTNRRQNVLELMAADLETGHTRTVVREEQPNWQDNRPQIRFLEDGQRFIWETERGGFKQYELRSLNGSTATPLTRGNFPVASIVHLNEEAELLYYTAFALNSADKLSPLHAQLFSVRLDGTGQQQLTHSPANHSIQFSPDGDYFIDTSESIDQPPRATLHKADGTLLCVLAESDLTSFGELKCTMPEPLALKAADDSTELFGVLYKPSHFDPSGIYPLLIDVYGGPMSQSVRARFIPAVAACEYGFLIAKIDNRGTRNRGKTFEDAAYMKLGDVDLADQAAAVQQLIHRPYVDKTRVGIFGHSYGGYMAALAILKYPDLFHAAVANAPVTDWRHYDSIYTERFMRLPDENASGYEQGSCITHADNLQGKLLIQHGMLDDNVHPNNAFRLIDALQKANKSFDVMMYPNAGHGLMQYATQLRWKYLRQHLLH